MSEIDVDSLERWVSSDRLSRYSSASSDPVALYLWNAAISAALFEVIGHVEILLRNALNEALRVAFGDPWWTSDVLRLNDRTKADLARATARAASGGVTTTGKVVAELTFGFWRYLLSAAYTATVWPKAQRAFSGLPKSARSRHDIEAAVARVHRLRNRIAHHEAVFDLDLTRAMRDLTFVARAIDPFAAETLARGRAVTALLRERPVT